MSYRLMFTINAVVLAIFGVVLMIMPQFVLSQFKSDIYVATLFATRFFGSALLMSGLFLWVLKDIATVKMQKNIGYLLLAYSIGGFVMSVLGMTSVGIFRANGWVLLVVFGLFALVYGYILFLQPKPSPAKARTPRNKVKDTPKMNDTPSVNGGQSL
jgi:MFS family permease